MCAWVSESVCVCGHAQQMMSCVHDVVLTLVEPHRPACFENSGKNSSAGSFTQKTPSECSICCWEIRDRICEVISFRSL